MEKRLKRQVVVIVTSKWIKGLCLCFSIYHALRLMPRVLMSDQFGTSVGIFTNHRIIVVGGFIRRRFSSTSCPGCLQMRFEYLQGKRFPSHSSFLYKYFDSACGDLFFLIPRQNFLLWLLSLTLSLHTSEKNLSASCLYPLLAGCSR